MSDIKEKLRIANKVEKIKDKPAQERIKELEQENADLMDAVIELASIIAEVE